MHVIVRKRPSLHQRRAYARKLEAAALAGVINFNPGQPGYVTELTEPSATHMKPGQEHKEKFLDIPLSLSPLAYPGRIAHRFSPDKPLASLGARQQAGSETPFIASKTAYFSFQSSNISKNILKTT